jgi:purine-binding chemotaxis protein CheW
VESRYAREVAPISELTPVPGTPAHVLGIINVRGQLLFVIDIKRFFDLPEKGLTDLNKIVIVHSETIGFGILADQIVGARTIDVDALQTSLPTLTGIREDYLKGITADRTVVLDAERLLSDRNILVQEAMAQAIPLKEPQEYSAQKMPVPEIAT